MKNEIGDKCFADSVTVDIEHNHVIVRAEVDGVMFDSGEYDGDMFRWMNAIIERVHACALGKLN